MFEIGAITVVKKFSVLGRIDTVDADTDLAGNFNHINVGTPCIIAGEYTASKSERAACIIVWSGGIHWLYTDEVQQINSPRGES